MQIGQIIRNRRQQLGMTQDELAQKVHVTPQAVSQWENGDTFPDLFNLGAIGRALELSKSELLGESWTGRPSWTMRDSFYSADNMRRKLKQFAAEEGLEQTARAVDYAEKKHAKCLRKPNVFTDEQVPYIVHPFAMACHAHAIGIRDDAVLATVLLHDVVEDCDVTADELPFSDEVREAVALLSKPKDRTNFSDEEYYERIKDNSTAAIVKALDRCNNVSTMMGAFPVEKVIEYVDETEDLVIPLLDHIKVTYPEYYDAAFMIKYQIYSTIESVKSAILRL